VKAARKCELAAVPIASATGDALAGYHQRFVIKHACVQSILFSWNLQFCCPCGVREGESNYVWQTLSLLPSKEEGPVNRPFPGANPCCSKVSVELNKAFGNHNKSVLTASLRAKNRTAQ